MGSGEPCFGVLSRVISGLREISGNVWHTGGSQHFGVNGTLRASTVKREGWLTSKPGGISMDGLVQKRESGRGEWEGSIKHWRQGWPGGEGGKPKGLFPSTAEKKPVLSLSISISHFLTSQPMTPQPPEVGSHPTPLKRDIMSQWDEILSKIASFSPGHGFISLPIRGL